MLVAASKSAPIDIIVALGNPEDFNATNSAEPGAEIIGTLGNLGPRWRHVQFRLPWDAVDLFRPALEGPLPNLLSLSVTTDTSWDFSLSASCLKQLYIYNEYAFFSTPTATPWHHPALVSLSTNELLIAEALCRHNFNNLTELCLIHKMNNPPTERLHLPRLASLTVEDVHFLPHIHAPSLNCLGAYGGGNFDSLNLLSGFTSVETLVLYGQLNEDIPAGLWNLTGIQFLIFRIPEQALPPSHPYFEYSISSDFFKGMSVDQRGFTWPRLRCIRFGRPRAEMTAICERYGLLQFVQERNAEHTTAQRVARIEEIVIEHPSIIMDPESAVQLAQLTILRDEFGSL